MVVTVLTAGILASLFVGFNIGGSSRIIGPTVALGLSYLFFCLVPVAM